VSLDSRKLPCDALFFRIPLFIDLFVLAREEIEQQAIVHLSSMGDCRFLPMKRKPSRSMVRSDGLCSTIHVLTNEAESRNARVMSFELAMVEYPRLRRICPDSPQNVAVLNVRSTLLKPTNPMGVSSRSEL